VAGGLTEAEAAARFGLIDVESYRVFLDLDAAPDVVRSRSEIRFRCREPGAETFADLTAPVLRRAVLNGKQLDPAGALSDGRLRLTGLAPGNVLTVDAESPRAGAGNGLSWFTDPADDGTYVLGSCFPTSAPSVFCCFDQPDLRAGFTLTVAAPAGWHCVANGPVASRPADGQAGEWRFAAVPAMKAYELALCAGPYVTVAEEDYQGAGGTVRLSVSCRPALAGSPGLAQVAGLVRQVLGFYEPLLGSACPYPKYDIVFAPELGPLAVSLPGVMTVSETLLQRMAGPGDDLAPVVLAHETAHLWFGCLVEGRWWDDLWLAEALATYLSYLAATEALGLESPWAGFGMREQAAAYRADRLPGTQPVSSPVSSAAEAMSRPPAITYSKGASVIRQLAALIGDDALRAGFRDYLTRYGGSATTLADLVGCWSQASGRDLAGWAGEWLRAPGLSTLRPELAVAPDGTIGSLAVVQQPPRTHRIAIGLYQQEAGRLRRRRLVGAELAGGRSEVPGLAGEPVPDALIVNDGGLTFAQIRFDDRSLRALTGCAMDVGDPVTEAVCWNAAWDMTTAAELPVAEFTSLAARRITARHPPPGLADLLQRAITGADYYADPRQRPGLRERLADAALECAGRARPGSQAQRAAAAGFAASAQNERQLGLLRSWLGGASLPEGLAAGPELRGQILATLSARDLAAGDELAALAAGDPVSGEEQAATCRALRPDPAAKAAAWAAALAGGQSPRMAMAHARGIWAPGQEDILAPYRDRYFAEALTAATGHEPRTVQRLAGLLYPATLADSATISATDAALAAGDLPAGLRLVLLDQGAILRQVLAARAAG
jgi:aminopeptidase N